MYKFEKSIENVVAALSGWIKDHHLTWEYLCGIREPDPEDLMCVLLDVEDSLDDWPELEVAVTMFLARNYHTAKRTIYLGEREKVRKMLSVHFSEQ